MRHIQLYASLFWEEKHHWTPINLNNFIQKYQYYTDYSLCPIQEIYLTNGRSAPLCTCNSRYPSSLFWQGIQIFNIRLSKTEPEKYVCKNMHCFSKDDDFLCFITSSNRWAKFNTIQWCYHLQTFQHGKNECTPFCSLHAPRQVTIPGCKVKKETMLVCRTPPAGGVLWMKEILASLSPGKNVNILVLDLIKCVWKWGEKNNRNY